MSDAVRYCQSAQNSNKTCAAIRTLPGVSDDEKEGFLKEAKLQKTRIKEVVYDILASNNIEIVE